MRFLILTIVFSFTVKAFPSDTLRKRIMPIFSELMRIPSVSGNERPALEYMLKKSAEAGFYTRQFCDKDSFMNVSASLYPFDSGKPVILFLAHLDVVPAADSTHWRFPPFSGKIENDTLWGRGCLDMKGIALMEFFALRALRDSMKGKELTYNPTLLFVSDEEKGGVHGAKFIAENYMDLLKPALVIGEGGGGFREFLPSKPEKLVFSVSLAEKKSLWLKLSVKHSAGGHGAMASSETANSILIKAIGRVEEKKPIIIFDKTTKRMFKTLGKMNGGFEGFILRNINAFWLRPFRRKILNKEPLLLNEVISTTQFTNIYNPPAPPNVIPSEASAEFDCRLLPGVNTKRFIRRLKLKMLSPKVKIEIIDESPTADASPDDERFDTIESSLKNSYPGSEVLPVLFPATTDNSYFRAKGIPAYGVLPLELSLNLVKTVHNTNECIPVPTILKGIEAYRKLMSDLMGVK